MDIAQKLEAIKNNNLYRTYKTFSSPQVKQSVINGKPTLLFSSNSYLGIANQPEIKEKVIRTVEKYGTGAGGSRLTTGNYDLHLELEQRLAEFKATEAALVFNSGYVANLGILSSLCGEQEVIFSDALNHASIIDGCRLAKARTVIYAHNDPDDLKAKINELKPKGGLVVTDSVFSMDGDIARLPELISVAHEHGLWVMVDDAHATGVIGRTGRGIAEHFGLSHDEIDIVMGTLSKAIAGEGGFICGTAEVCEYLRNTARSFIFTTALAPATIAAALGGIEYITSHPEAVQKLQENISYFIGRLNEHEIKAASETAIIPIVIGDEKQAQTVSAELLERGVFVPCIRYPTVKKGAARLRFTLMASHTHSEIDYAVECLKEVLR